MVGLSSEISRRRAEAAHPGTAVDEVLRYDVRYSLLVLQAPTDFEQAGLQEGLAIFL